MSEFTEILSAAEQGDPRAAEELLPLVYAELRRLAAQRLANEKPGQTIQPTALVHEAYLRLLGPSNAAGFDGRRHFFASAAEAMRRILVENARRKARVKHGGGRERQELRDEHQASDSADERLIALDAALEELAAVRADLAELVRLRYFAGLTVEQAAEILEVSPRTLKRNWAYASAWLRREMEREAEMPHAENNLE